MHPNTRDRIYAYMYAIMYICIKHMCCCVHAFIGTRSHACFHQAMLMSPSVREKRRMSILPLGQMYTLAYPHVDMLAHTHVHILAHAHIYMLAHAHIRLVLVFRYLSIFFERLG